MYNKYYIFQASGGGDASVRLWSIKPAVNSAENIVNTTLLNSTPSLQVCQSVV